MVSESPQRRLGNAYDNYVDEDTNPEFDKENSIAGSPCESPVKGEQYRKHHNPPCIISPGKLKTHVTQQRAEIMENILLKQREIEDNSPSKTSSMVNRNLIQQLKERRLEQRSKSREGIKPATILQDSTNIINRIRQEMQQ